MIEIIRVEETESVSINQLKEPEKIIRFSFELDFNLEGTKPVIHLLMQIDEVLHEVNALKNRLRLSENIDY